jgi:hypothetical protein
LLERKDFQALLLFNETIEIKKVVQLLEKESNKLIEKPENKKTVKFQGKDIEFSDYKSLTDFIREGLDITQVKFKTSKTISKEPPPKKEPKVKRNNLRKVKFDSKDDELVGFIAELISYHKLVSKYGETCINWVSENAFRAYPEKFITAEAGKGYDLEIKDSGRIRYVEIKGTSNIQNGIHMSDFEMKKAEEFPDKYDLLIVENPLSKEPVCRFVRSPFKFKKDETLFSNSRLKVTNDNYIIKFTWDG